MIGKTAGRVGLVYIHVLRVDDDDDDDDVCVCCARVCLCVYVYDCALDFRW